MKGAPFGNPGNANLRGRLSIRWADGILRNLRMKERIKIAEKESVMDTSPFQPSRNVDYGMPIEAVCRDGSVIGAKVMGYDHDPCEPYSVLIDGVAGTISGYSDGLTGLGFTIRNVAEPVQPTASDDIAKRMEALVRKCHALTDYDHPHPDAPFIGKAVTAEEEWLADEARAIVALLPEPVDADLVEARRIAAEHALEDFHREAVLEGVSDDAPAVKSVLAAIKRGRELAGKVNSHIVFEAIQHGDTEHRDWLREALDAVFAGRSIPTPRGKGVA